MGISILVLITLIAGYTLSHATNTVFALLYGFVVFFGWLTVLIFGMTFKTLPFIIWDKVYQVQSGKGTTPRNFLCL
ncbi:MAG: hypothetical protein NTW54_10940 [Bacteroidetes bacterium]|nr:hypothetical protein [Bacteroidota bacterium]